MLFRQLISVSFNWHVVYSYVKNALPSTSVLLILPIAPTYAVAFATRSPEQAFLAGSATAVGTSLYFALRESIENPSGTTRERILQFGITCSMCLIAGMLVVLPFTLNTIEASLLLGYTTIIAIIGFATALSMRAGSHLPRALYTTAAVTALVFFSALFVGSA